MSESPKGLERIVGTVAVAILIFFLAGIAISTWKKSGRPEINPNVYQTVFLDNSQQYFGHLKGVGTRHPYLTDIYYVQNIQNPSVGSQFTLFKLGNELHGPDDVMYLNWDHVTYWENLRSDSQIVQKIYEEKAQRAGMPAQ